jgi:hypothetical protein
VLCLLCRARNIRNTTAVDLSAVSLQYWFDGPVEGSPLFADYSPEQFFTVQCEWATTGVWLGAAGGLGLEWVWWGTKHPPGSVAWQLRGARLGRQSACSRRQHASLLLPAPPRTRTPHTHIANTLHLHLLPQPLPPAGCDSVALAVLPGFQSTPGAAFALNITFNPKAGLLLPNGENAVPALFLGK